MERGYIKMYRKTLDNPIICKDSDHFFLWHILLLLATHKEYKGYFGKDIITLKPGQLITGRRTLSEKTRISESKIERILKCFEREQQIEQQTSSKNRLITILNWELYQQNEQQNEQQVNNKWTTSEQQVNTYKNDKNDKNDKNEINNKKKNKKEKVETVEFEIVYFQNDDVNKLFKDFLEQRKENKVKNTDRAINLLIKELNKYDDDVKKQMIEKSIMNNWKGVFPPKQQSNYNSKKQERQNDFDEFMKMYYEEELKDE